MDLSPQEWKAECEAYLTAQGPWVARSRRYRAASLALNHMGFQNGDLVVDVGAGMCDFAAFMYTEGYRFRYVPIDGSISGIDLESDILTLLHADWYVCIETIEHMADPWMLADFMQGYADKGMVITTPNAAVTNVLELDPTHKCGLTLDDFYDHGYLANTESIHYDQDTILATWQRP